MSKITEGRNAAQGYHLLNWSPYIRRAAKWMAMGTALLAAAASTCIWGAIPHPGGWSLDYRGEYLWVVALVVSWMAVVGKAYNGHFKGLLIDGRNMVSLSRLQLFVWLVIVGCAFAVAVAHNFTVPVGSWKNGPDPDSVKVPLYLGLVMGVSTTSFVASPAILSLKTRRKPSASELANAHLLVRDGARLHPNSGRLYARSSSAYARWADLFRGEELETAGSADPAKVQQFLVTFMLATIYLAALWRSFAGMTGDAFYASLPPISEGGLVLLGVSHAAYLGGKAVPQTPGGPQSNIPRVDTAPQLQASTRRPPSAPCRPPLTNRP